jgi:hypothetical protein
MTCFPCKASDKLSPLGAKTHGYFNIIWDIENPDVAKDLEGLHNRLLKTTLTLVFGTGCDGHGYFVKPATERCMGSNPIAP